MKEALAISDKMEIARTPVLAEVLSSVCFLRTGHCLANNLQVTRLRYTGRTMRDCLLTRMHHAFRVDGKGYGRYKDNEVDKHGPPLAILVNPNIQRETFVQFCGRFFLFF